MAEDSGRLCWKCGTRYGNEVKLCVRCGVNLETGDALSDHTAPGSDPFAATGVVGFIGRTLPGIMKPAMVVAALMVAAVGFVSLSAGFGAFGMARYSSTGSMMLLGVPGLALWAQGTAWLLVGRYTWLPEALGDLDGLRWAIFFSSLAFEGMLVVGMVKAMAG